ncbi:MAG: hypothetical protein ACYDIB_05640 [Desulfobulbia bacterium]|nr:MAG: hypothetical protein CVU58_00730 [Deltaproteobacteria bacterium HGW-Deltaproteobacteria-16]
MNTKIQKILQIVLGLTLIGVIGYGIWLLARAFVDAISAASPEVSAAIVGAMATILVGVSAVLLSQAHERKRAAEEAHRLRKVEIYQGFIDMVSRLIGATNENLSVKEPDPQELVQYLFKFKSDILLWGSPKVIRAQIEFETVSGSGNTKKVFSAVNSLYLAIRDDIGLSNSGLSNLELVKLYLNEDARKELG